MEYPPSYPYPRGEKGDTLPPRRLVPTAFGARTPHNPVHASPPKSGAPPLVLGWLYVPVNPFIVKSWVRLCISYRKTENLGLYAYRQRMLGQGLFAFGCQAWAAPAGWQGGNCPPCPTLCPRLPPCVVRWHYMCPINHFCLIVTRYENYI